MRVTLAFAVLLAALPARAGADATPKEAPPTESVAVTGHAVLDNPDGKGDPDTITCRKQQQLPGQRLMGPSVCKSNAEWAQIRKDGNDVSPDGRSIVPSEKARALNPAFCQQAAAPRGTGNMTTSDFNPSCSRSN